MRVVKYGASVENVTGRKGGKKVTGNLHERDLEATDFTWSREKEVAFQAIKHAIANNAMALPDPHGQYHLAVDASKLDIGGVLFQLEGLAPGTEAGNSSVHCLSERIIMVLSFRLSDAETRYFNSEREVLAVIRYLAEVRWMVISVRYGASGAP